MWTQRKQYLTQFIEISDYLKKHGFFHDFLIGSFSYDSQEKSIFLPLRKILLQLIIPIRLPLFGI